MTPGDGKLMGTRVTAVDVATGDGRSVVIKDDFVVICDGAKYVHHIARYGNGTTVVTIKTSAP